jgi:lipopolysaccharide transport system permease protein
VTAGSVARAGARPVTEIRSGDGIFALELDSVWEYRELLFFLVWREIKIRYKQAGLGIAWAIIQPVLAVLIFTVVFGNFARMPSEGLPYPVFALAAVLPWTYFAEALRRSATGLVGDADLVRKIYFPRLVIPLAGVTSPLIDLLFGLIILIALMVWHRIVPTWSLLLLPFWLMLTMALALAIGLWLAPVNVRYRDIMHTLPFVIQVWMYATPIVYPLSMVPARWQALYSVNPMVGIIEGFRWSLLGIGRPDTMAIGISMLVISVVLFGGLLFFRRAERLFADVI